MTAILKKYSKEAIANTVAKSKNKKAGEELYSVHQINEGDDIAWVIFTAEEFEAYTAPVETQPEPEVEQPIEQGSDEGQKPEGDEGGDEPAKDMGVNPVGLDRSTTVMEVEHFGRTRYVIQEAQTDGSRKFLPAAGETLTAWKFHALQFDTAEQAAGYIAGEEGLSVVPFRKAWLETFHPKMVGKPEVEVPAADAEDQIEVPEGYELNEGEIGKWTQTDDGPVWVKMEQQEGEAA